MEELSKINAFNFSEVEYKCAETILAEIAFDGVRKVEDNSPYWEDLDFDEQYNGSCVAHPYFNRCNFNGTKFIGINGIASHILDCYFKKVEFRDSGMAFSDFSGTHFIEKTLLINCSCTESSFLDVNFSDVFAEGSVFDKSYFINTVFERTKFCHCSFEDALFQNTLITNCDLIHANLEYANFQNVRLTAVNLPFWGILRAFGGLQTIQKYPDSTIQYADSSKRLSINRFLELLPDLQAYFAKKNEYFILANINIFLGNQKAALYYVMNGLKHSLEQRDFRMIRYLCRLASINHFFTSKELRQLYQALVANSQVSQMNDHQYQLYLREISEIKRLLIDNPFSRPQMIITCSTDIDSQDYIGLASLMQFFEQVIYRELPQCSYYYSVRHNSPPILEYFLSDLLPNLYTFASVISLALLGASSSLNIYQKMLDCQSKRLSNKFEKKTQEEKIRNVKLQNDLLESQIEHQKLVNEKLRAEITDSLESEKSSLLLTSKYQMPQELHGKVKDIRFTIQSSDPAAIPLRSYIFTAS